jgi:hypothetical protein
MLRLVGAHPDSVGGDHRRAAATAYRPGLPQAPTFATTWPPTQASPERTFVQALTRKAYVVSARRLRSVAEKTRVLDRLERSESARVRHLRTLFAIHDVDDLIRLDLPWWVYDASDRVDQFLESLGGQARVFEYGSGASTFWLSRRAAMVDTVEHHPGFAAFMSARCQDLPNVRVHHVPAVHAAQAPPKTPSSRFGHKDLDFTDYVAAIDAVPGKFDLLVIDGRAREACLAHAAPRVRRGGLVVFDNSDRRRYRDAVTSSRLSPQTFRGAAPALPYPSQTTLLHKDGGAS